MAGDFDTNIGVAWNCSLLTGVEVVIVNFLHESRGHKVSRNTVSVQKRDKDRCIRSRKIVNIMEVTIYVILMWLVCISPLGQYKEE